MSRFRVYIKPFDETGVYLSSFTEITKDVASLSSIKQQLDSSEYDVGIYRNSQFSLGVRNDTGKYSDVDGLRSIFRYKRSDSIVRITWDYRDWDLIAGFHGPVEPLTPEETIFEGLLTDVSSFSNIETQDVKFTILGYEVLFDRVTTPYSSINNGDNISDVILACLNQTEITGLLTVSGANISVGQDTTIDDKTSLENKTVKEALEELLLISNSVLRVEGTTVYVSSRDAAAALSKTFYGQASITGIESIIDINKYRDGTNRTFNFWTWKDTALVSQDTSSVIQYGILKKEIDSDLILDASTAKIQALLDSNKTEFSYPKVEMELMVPITYENLALNLLDRVAIDYPPVFQSFDGNPLPRYGQDTYGNAVYPYSQWSLRIGTEDRFKIISKVINPKDDTMMLGIREI